MKRFGFEDARTKPHLNTRRPPYSWNQLVQYTTYKAEEAGRRVVLVDLIRRSTLLKLRRNRTEETF